MENISQFSTYTLHPITLLILLQSISGLCWIWNWIFYSTVGGDFNCHLNPLLDRLLAETVAPSKRARALAATCDEFGFVDIWRTVHPDLKELIFSPNAHKTSSRIDFVFIPKLLLSSVVSCEIGNISVSDHSPVFLQLLFNGKQSFTNSWRFNPTTQWPQIYLIL